MICCYQATALGPIGPQGPHMGPWGPKGPMPPRGHFWALWGPKGPSGGTGGLRGSPRSPPEAPGTFLEKPGFWPPGGLPTRGLESGCLDSQRVSGLTSGVWNDIGCLE